MSIHHFEVLLPFSKRLVSFEVVGRIFADCYELRLKDSGITYRRF